MIIERVKENLSTVGVNKIDFNDLAETALAHEGSWRDRLVSNLGNVNIRMTPDACLSYRDDDGFYHTSNVTQNAFEQYCNTIGVPSSYAQKCYERGMGELAVENFDRWAMMNAPAEMKVRSYGDEGDVHAIVSTRFTSLSNSRVFDLLENSVDFDRYQCNQAFLSPEKMHLRFVDFTPLPNVPDRMFAGFTVQNNEIGRGALSVKFFLYRYACKNGLVKVEKGGTLFRQKHIGLTFEDQVEFQHSFQDIEALKESSVAQILAAQKKNLSFKEMESYLERVRKDLHLGKALTIGERPAQEWIEDEFGPNLWGVVNFITQKAQEYSLDDRVDMETYAGRLLAAA